MENNNCMQKIAVTKAGRWPYVVQIILQFLGVFHGQKIIQNRKCLMCRDESGEHVLGELQRRRRPQSTIDIRGVIQEESGCYVCESLMWNCDGKVVVYSDENIVTGVTNHRFSRLVALTTNVFILGVMCYDLVILLDWLWGKEDDVLHLVSFMTYWIPIVSVPGCCLIAHVCNIACADCTGRWFAVFNPNYIARRLNFYLPLKTDNSYHGYSLTNIPFFVLCIFWPFVNTCLECLNFYQQMYYDGKSSLHLVITAVSLLMFGSFCYLLQLLRDSLDSEYNLVIAFLIQHQHRSVDLSRCRIVELFRDYRLLRKVVKAWMVLILSCATLGLTVHLSWNYTVYTRRWNGSQTEEMSKYKISWMNLLILSEKFMILFLPVLAIGDFHLENSWKQFCHAIARLRVEKHEDFWKKVLKICYEINHSCSTMTVTIAWCVIGLYLGLHLGEQNTNYNTKPG